MRKDISGLKHGPKIFMDEVKGICGGDILGLKHGPKTYMDEVKGLCESDICGLIICIIEFIC